jgi:hypothetical protein
VEDFCISCNLVVTCGLWRVSLGHSSIAISARLRSPFGGCGPCGYVPAKWAQFWAQREIDDTERQQRRPVI